MKYITTHSKVAGEIGHWSFALGCACYTYWRPYTYTDRYGENDDDDCDDVLLMVMDGPCYTYSSVYRL